MSNIWFFSVMPARFSQIMSSFTSGDIKILLLSSSNGQNFFRIFSVSEKLTGNLMKFTQCVFVEKQSHAG